MQLDFVGNIFTAIGGWLNSIQACLAPYIPDQSVPALLAFALYVIMIVFGGLLAVAARNLVRALMGLVLTFLGVAGMYLLLASPFLAFMQLLIYIGAICILVFFAILLTKNTADGDEAKLPGPINAIYAILAGLAPLVVAGPLIFMNASKIAVQNPEQTNTAELGTGLLSSYVLPFELISIVLLVAMTGGVFLAFKKRQSSHNK